MMRVSDDASILNSSGGDVGAYGDYGSGDCNCDEYTYSSQLPSTREFTSSLITEQGDP